MRISARNQLQGTVKTITHGAINSEVVLEIAPGIFIEAQVTTASVHNLGLNEGSTAYALIKADSVMLGVDH
ncbi:MAG: molybdopterin-binding protein [Candidatus Accumulibacter sp.]|jgi:molybdopterin-binding protein|nr:molybdopterin-binding protein [Accumulibacter sp.]